MKNIFRKIIILSLLIVSACAVVFKVEAAIWNFSERAPEFRKGMDWLNVAKPVHLGDLKGKFVLLHFWTASSPECLDNIAKLKPMSVEYANELIIVGVHAARFSAERETASVRSAILKYGIEYPVVNDPDLLIWRDYGVSIWPTMILIDPTGKIVFQRAGKRILEPIEEILAKGHARVSSASTETLIKIALEKNKEIQRPLNFPSRVIADPQADRLFISDSGHHRILLTDFTGDVTEIIGSGKSGLVDGDFTLARFEQPQGLALQGDTLYVADQGNHTIRKVDLLNKKVVTIAGTGQRSKNLRSYGDATTVDLDTPLDLTILGNELYIAMAGTHQIWVLDLNTHMIRVFAGTGQQNIIDGPLRMSVLAQPSGLTTDGKSIYFTDSVVSAVRNAEVRTGGYVHTVMGYDFFIFGDRDGDRGWTRLHYPLGIVYLPDGLLAVTDTYNNKVKLIDKVALITSALSGSGKIGDADGGSPTASFFQPQGITYKQNKIYVADTNNHLIRVIDLQGRKVSTLALRFAKGKIIPEELDPVDLKGDPVPILQAKPDHLNKIKLSITLPPGHKFLAEGMNTLRLYTGEGKLFKSFKIRDLNPSLTVNDHLKSKRAFAQLMLYYCREGDKGICKVKTILFTIPLKPSEQGQDWELKYTVLP